MSPASPVPDGVQPVSTSGEHRASDASAKGRQIEQWLREARAGSPTAFGRALQASRKYLLTIAQRALADELRAKIGASDLVQDTFVEAQRDFHRFMGTSEEELFDWLTALLANRILNSVRHYKGTKKRDIRREVDRDAAADALVRVADVAGTPGTAAIMRDEERRVHAAMSQLSNPFRDVLVLRTWQRQSFRTIGHELGCSADAARKLWGRALVQLQQILDQTS